MAPALDSALRRGSNECGKKKKRVGPGVTFGGGRIAVDLWKTAGTSARHFFLTHCHTDHTHGLTPSWRHGPIYCSPITARLLKVMFDLDDSLLRPLEVNESHQLADFCVTLLEANHCPGAVMFLFESDSFGTVLCTGDMRHDHRMEKMFATEPAFMRLQKLTIDHIYLDNTYLDEKIAEFPTREEAISE
uniref:Metallo-beta-lactamase domain-containing protein n=1 Tax=Plectus sambesii TaxID=2011161 RepID=A0A914UPY2_9BILA